LDKSYELYEWDPTGYVFTHDAFTIQTSPITHNLCGGLTYTSTFNGGAIDANSPAPIHYNGSSRTHYLYSENTSLLDMTDGTTVLPYTGTLQPGWTIIPSEKPYTV
jgi:hypothetical protein